MACESTRARRPRLPSLQSRKHTRSSKRSHDELSQPLINSEQETTYHKDTHYDSLMTIPAVTVLGHLSVGERKESILLQRVCCLVTVTANEGVLRGEIILLPVEVNFGGIRTGTDEYSVHEIVVDFV